MANLLRLGSLLILSILLNTGCKWHCPAFPSEQRAWFPYAVDDNIKLYGETDTIILTVSKLDMSKEYSSPRNQDDHVCVPEMYCKTDIDSTALMSMDTHIIRYPDDEYPSIPPLPSLIAIDIFLYGYLEDQSLTPVSHDTFFYDIYYPQYYTFQDSALIRGRMYYDVLSMKNDENKRFINLVLSKGVGIVELEDKDHNIWYIN